MNQPLVFPELSPSTQQRPRHCPGCGRVGLARHQVRRRGVIELKVPEIQVVQYQCGGCGRSVSVGIGT